MQKPCPPEVKGVPVTLMAVKEDGKAINIGTAVTNGFYGTFALAWTPPEEGVYTIIATFNGDESYGSSSAATALLVTAAPPAAATAQQVSEQAAATQATMESLQQNQESMRSLVDILLVLVAIAIIIGIVNVAVIIKKAGK